MLLPYAGIATGGTTTKLIENGIITN